MTTPPLVAFPGRLQIADANGAPCPGARLCISGKVRGSAGGATEMMALYADASHTIPLSNPVVADASGMLPLIYLDSSPFDCMASSDNRVGDPEVRPWGILRGSSSTTARERTSMFPEQRVVG